VAQYLQYRVTLSHPAGQDLPVVDNIQVFYVQENAPPIIKKVDITKITGPGQSQIAALAAAASRMQSAMPTPIPSGSEATDKAAKAASEAQASAAQAAMAARAAASHSESSPQENSQRIAITWDASDPNDDDLKYRLLFKGEDETQWKLIEENLKSPRFFFSTEALPDGKYRIKVEASDAAENQETSASTVSMISRVYVVDNTPPDILNLKGTRVGKNEFEISADAVDKTSIISGAEYNIDADKEWRALQPVDGIFDLNHESFKVKVKPEKPSPEHTLSVRVYDREGNSRVEKVLLR
jgi:hypothetical protein